MTVLSNLEGVSASVGQIARNSPGEGSASGSANGSDGVESLGVTPAKDEGGWGLILGGVCDGVGLASLDTRGRVVVDLNSPGSRDEGSARKEDLEETHVGGSMKVVIRYVLLRGYTTGR